LGVEIFSPSDVFNLTMPVIGKYQAIARLRPGERSTCEYNATKGRYWCENALPSLLFLCLRFVVQVCLSRACLGKPLSFNLKAEQRKDVCLVFVHSAPLKAAITAATNTGAAASRVLRPRMSFTVSGTTAASNTKAAFDNDSGAAAATGGERWLDPAAEIELVVLVHSYSESGGVGEVVAELPVVHCAASTSFRCETDGSYRAR
jgi:hypothetical protein